MDLFSLFDIEVPDFTDTAVPETPKSAAKKEKSAGRSSAKKNTTVTPKIPAGEFVLQDALFPWRTVLDEPVTVEALQAELATTYPAFGGTNPVMGLSFSKGVVSVQCMRKSDTMTKPLPSEGTLHLSLGSYQFSTTCHGQSFQDAVKEATAEYPFLASCGAVLTDPVAKGDPYRGYLLPTWDADNDLPAEQGLPFAIGVFESVSITSVSGRLTLGSLLKEYQTQFPHSALRGLHWVADLERFLPVYSTAASVAVTADKDVRVPLPVTIFSGFSKLVLDADTFGDVAEVTLEEIRKELVKIYPAYTKDRSMLQYDAKTKFVIANLKSSSKGALYREEAPAIASLLASTDCDLYLWDDCRVETTPIGVFATTTKSLCFYPRVPKIPKALFEAVTDDFLAHAQEERAVLLYWDTVAKEYLLHFPVQRVTPVSVQYEYPEEFQASERYVLAMEWHSHGRIGAFFSQTDDAHELMTCLYAVTGDITDDGGCCTIARAGMAGRFVSLALEDIFALHDEEE